MFPSAGGRTPPQVPAAVFQFGEFRLDCDGFELLRNGHSVRVERKPMELLILLASREGQLVTRIEIAERLWSSEVFVDTEHGINTAIRKLRYLLRDDPENPQFIQTVTGKGYRFIASMTRIEHSGTMKPTDVSVASGDTPVPDELKGISVNGDSLDHPSPATTAKPEAHSPARRRSRAWPGGWALVGGVLALFLVAAVWYMHRPLPPPRITRYTQITHDGHQKTLVGTDGSRLYFNRMSGPITPGSVAEVAIAGGEIAPIPVPLPNPFLADVSPNTASFLISADRGLWNVRILGGQARYLGDAYHASFSPDGNLVAMSATDGGIYVEGGDGTGSHKLAHVGDSVSGIPPASDLVWSPDGGAIRFTMKDRIWEISSSGSNLREVMPGWHGSAECCGKWTPDGKLFLFISDGQIWVHEERRAVFRRPSAEPIQMTQGPIRWGGPFPGKHFPGEFWGRPVPSKDGSTIFALGLSSRGELSRFDSKAKQFQPFLGGISAQGVSYSKDGKSIAFVSYPEGILWKADRNGNNPVQLTDPPLQAFMPRWSPDGKQISFAGDYPGPNGAFYLVSSYGGSPRKFVAEDAHLDGFLTWSPDGHRMAGTSTSPDGKFVVVILNLDTRKDTIIPGSIDMFEPRWSPDGRYLAAAGFEVSTLKVFDFKTGKWSELAQSADCPEWSADSKYIYFRRVVGDVGVFRIRPSGGKAEKVVDLKHWHDTGWFGRYMGLDPTDAPLLLRDIGSEDIYALALDQK